MQDVNKQLLDAVKHCHGIFDQYVSHHLAKPDYDKAAANERHRAICAEAIAAAEQAQQAEPVSVPVVPAYAYQYAAQVMESIRGASQWCDCQAFGIADGWINETQGGTMLPACQSCKGYGVVTRHAQDGSHDDAPCQDCAAPQDGVAAPKEMEVPDCTGYDLGNNFEIGYATGWNECRDAMISKMGEQK